MDAFTQEVGNAQEGAGRGTREPRLRVAVVSSDENLRQILHESIQLSGLPLDVGFEITRGAAGLEPEHLAQLRASDPDMVILDMSDDPVRAIRTANAIASGDPRAALVGVGPELEASCLLDAVRAGLVEYVPRPIDPPTVRDALQRVMRKLGWANTSDGRRSGKLHAFFSAKGGSGSTSVVTNVGIELHRLTGQKVLLVDLDLELGEIASLLGVEPRFHFVDLIRNFHRMDADLLDSYIESHESGVKVLSAPFEPQTGEEVTGEQIAQTLGFLRSHFDYVLVDISKSLAPPAQAALEMADLIFLVTNLDVPSLRNLKRCLPILDRAAGGEAQRLRLVVNRFNPKSLVRLDDLEDTLGIGVYATLTNDFNAVIRAISTGQPLVLHSSSRYAQQLKELAARIVEGPATKNGARTSLAERLLAPFRSRSSGIRSSTRNPELEGATHG